LGCITTGEEAIEFVQNTKPDVILMDINLVGEIDGIEAAEVITEKSKIPVIFMIGYEETEIYERAQKTKPVAYLTKPVEIWDLKPIFESIFN
jgi:two-component system, response regulator PdtaR